MPYNASSQGNGAQVAMGQAGGQALRRALLTAIDQRQNPEADLMTSIMRSYGIDPAGRSGALGAAMQAGGGGAAAGTAAEGAGGASLLKSL